MNQIMCPLVPNTVADEYSWLTERFGSYRRDMQSLVQLGDRWFDVLDIVLADATPVRVWFDITAMFQAQLARFGTLMGQVGQTDACLAQNGSWQQTPSGRICVFETGTCSEQAVAQGRCIGGFEQTDPAPSGMSDGAWAVLIAAGLATLTLIGVAVGKRRASQSTPQ
jgi:hypothetical protein